MNYEFDDLTPDVVRTVGFRERYRGYDPADVDPLLEQLAMRVEHIHDEIERLERQVSAPKQRKPKPAPDDVAAMAALLHIGHAAREARDIVLTARRRTGLTRALPEREFVNQDRARAMLYRPTSVDAMDERRCILTVHAHPDDEASKGAGTIAKYHAEGVYTVLVCCTGGEEGDILNPAMDTEEVRNDIGAVRMRELDAAAHVIGYDEVVLLGYRDSGMPDSEANRNPASFAQAPLEEAVGRLVAVLRRTRPQVVVTYHEKQERYPHPDHLRVHEVTMAAVDAAADPAQYPDAGEPWTVSKIYYTAWSFKRVVGMHEKFLELGLESPFDEKWFQDRKPDESDNETTTQIYLGGFEDVRQDALLAHATQIDPTSKFWFGLPKEVMREIHPYDDYVLARGPRGEGEVETDLFAGLDVPSRA
ncbi:MAG TPA: mycothiol conjugate amidase Mca [Acidimicrobiales bacterium]|nr:mycothiol conjugate amidase Mca [Acidimicrobiales bacterium]